MKGDYDDWARVKWRLREQDDFREAICAWLTLNGVDPKTVPIDSMARIADGKLTLNVWKDGLHQVDPTNPDKLLWETITVPVKVPPTYEVEDWLRP
jgi:hypothetical protein